MSLLVLAQPGALQGRDVITAEIVLPLEGAWHATLYVNQQTLPAGKMDLRVGDVVFSGTVVPTRARIVEGIAQVRLVAGAAGLKRQVTKRHYTGPSVRNVLAALAGNVGEKVSGTADTVVMDLEYPHWTVASMPAGDAIRALLERVPPETAPAGVGWRLLPDGTIWAGRETWPDAGVDALIVGEAGADGRIDLGLEVPFLLPGTTLEDGRRIDQVEMRATGSELRTTVWTADP